MKSFVQKRWTFVRLGGFHQLMSFLGSIGSLMGGSGLRVALETVYAPVTVGPMFTGKAYARAIHGHILSSSALVSIMMKEFWNTLSVDEKVILENIYYSKDPSLHQQDEVSQKLISWFTKKSIELLSSSCTSAL